MFATIGGVIGFLFVAFGVGGIENSVTNGELFYSCVWCVIGLVMMWIGVSELKENS
jgi:Na+/melibiose symporter-like transporter